MCDVLDDIFANQVFSFQSQPVNKLHEQEYQHFENIFLDFLILNFVI